VSDLAIKKINTTLSILVLILSPCFLYFTSMIFIKDGGSEGWGYLVLPFLIICNLFTISVLLTLIKKKTDNKFYFFINIIGCIYSILLLLLII
jgi:hypothetical protein